MKPAVFEYHAPTTVAAALAVLAVHGAEGKVLAGGQSLVPTMAFRLAKPATLIDINGISELDFCRVEDGVLRVGALTRHTRFDGPVEPGSVGRLLTDVVHNVAHTPIRSRGTLCGSLAHADPASEWCCVALTLGATMVVAGTGTGRLVPAAAWFRSIFTVDLAHDELLTEVRIPLQGADWRCGFDEFSRRAGDFALAMCVCAVRLDDGVIAEARLGLGGVASTPILAVDAAAALVGRVPDEAAFGEAAELAGRCFEPMVDVNASPEYRRELVRAVVKRSLRRAVGIVA